MIPPVGSMRKLTHTELIARQQQQQARLSRLPFMVVLNNIRSLHNVGSIFRTCDGVGVEKLWLCGITGYPPNPRLAQTALGAEREVPWEYRKDVVTLLKELKADGCQIVLLEQMAGSFSYDTFMPQPPACLVVGNEIEGVSSGIIPLCDAAVDIEMAGLKNSLNVSVAFGVVAYHFRSCFRCASTANSSQKL
jgi:tRNA G18 (ribose-2'-O)-methylase SpoU